MTRVLTNEEADALGIPKPRVLTDEEADALGIRAPHGVPKTALLHGAQGITAGTSDEATGLVAGALATGPGRWLRKHTGFLEPVGLHFPVNPDGSDPLAPTGGGFAEARKGAVESARQDLKESAHDNPGTAVVADIAGGVLSPVGKLGAGKALVGGTRAAVVAGAKAAAKQGAIAGAGYSEADVAEGEGGQLLADTLIGLGAGGVMGGAGAGIAKAGRKGADVLKARGVNAARAEEGLPKLPAGKALDEAHKAAASDAREKLTAKVLNEIAEGDAGIRTTPTKAKLLDKASEHVMDEVTTGPDAKKVRGAFLGDAASGRKVLGKVIDRVGNKSEAAYLKFEQAGVNEVEAGSYVQHLRNVANEANRSGATEDAALIDYMVEDFTKMWTRADAQITLPALRKWTTQIQGRAASAIGGLNDHSAAKLKARAAGVVTEGMRTALKTAAGDNAVLLKAAEEIAENNQRMHGLLTVDAALAMRQWKERTGKSAGRVVTEGLVGAGVVGGAGFLAGGDEKGTSLGAAGVLIGMGAGAGSRRAASAVGRWVERGQVTQAINKGIEASGTTRQQLAAEQAGRLGATASRGILAGHQADVAAEDPPADPKDMTDKELLVALATKAKAKDRDSYVAIAKEMQRRSSKRTKASDETTQARE